MSETFLEKIVRITRSKVERRKKDADLNELKHQTTEVRTNSEPHRLRAALGRKDRTNIIAEIKRASPSKGVINADIDIVDLARQYETGGAAAISVLTEEEFFRGSPDDLKKVRAVVDLPILRKDFIVDELQIYEGAAAGADAILLIVAALTEESLKNFLRLVRDDLGMDALVEVHTREELAVAGRVGANIIGVNNRNLHSLEVSLEVSRKLIIDRPEDVLMVVESGISTTGQIDELRKLGFDGFLIGETLMRTGDVEKQLGAWI